MSQGCRCGIAGDGFDRPRAPEVCQRPVLAVPKFKGANQPEILRDDVARIGSRRPRTPIAGAMAARSEDRHVRQQLASKALYVRLQRRKRAVTERAADRLCSLSALSEKDRAGGVSAKLRATKCANVAGR